MSKREILSFLGHGIGIASKEEHYSKIFLWIDFAFNFLFYGFTPKQYIALGVYKMRHKTKISYVNLPKSKKIECYFNNIRDSNFLSNKALFNTNFAHYIKRRWINTNSSSKDEIIEYFENVGRAIAKPIDSSGGRGIFIVDNVDEAVKLVGKKYLLEEIVENANPLKQFSKKSLNTIRLFTIVKKNGDVDVLSCYLRVGGGESITDNLHTGGHAVPIDYETGILSGEGRDYLSKRYEYNPISGMRYFGIQIPYWSEVKKSILEVAKIVPSCRYCAWDVAITNRGIEYIEGNVLPDPNFLQLSFGPKYSVFKYLMKNGQ